MISECMNPSCRRELRYLRDGRVVRVVKRDPDKVKVEHFWLCGDCYLNFDFHFSREGAISMARRIECTSVLRRPAVMTLVDADSGAVAAA